MTAQPPDPQADEPLVPMPALERDEWELPGGKLELGETAESTVLREVQEELTLEPELLAGVEIIDSWVYEIFPHRHVFIVSYGGVYTGAREPKLSHEHKELGLFGRSEIPNLVMPDEYKRTIAARPHRHAGGRARGRRTGLIPARTGPGCVRWVCVARSLSSCPAGAAP